MNKLVRRLGLCVLLTCVGAGGHVHATSGQPGTLDPTWATTSPLGPGKLITPVGPGDDDAHAALVQPDGKIVLAGLCADGVNTTNNKFCAVRYLPGGALDTSFSGNGKVITPVGLGGTAGAALLQPDGKIVLAGYCWNGSNYDFCALRYTSNGTLDTSFGSGGTVITAIGSDEDYAYAALLQPDGKIVLAGACNNGTHFNFCAVRYLPDGTLDTSFNGTGKRITSVGSGNDKAYGALLQPDGKIVLAGNCDNGGNTDFCAVRYLSSGALDTSFNGTGKVVTAVGSSDDAAYAALLQPDGKIVLAGNCLNGGSFFCALRYLPGGTLDTSFNGTGTVMTAVGAGSAYVHAALLQPDGNIILAGNCNNASVNFCAVRYLPTGALDTSFSGNGSVTTTIGSSSDIALAALLQPDGKILLAGSCATGSAYDFCAVRYDGGPFGYKNCSPDFDGDGHILATTDALIFTRVALGITGNAVIGGITFSSNATRNTWPLIRDYLVTQCGMSLVQ